MMFHRRQLPAGTTRPLVAGSGDAGDVDDDESNNSINVASKTGSVAAASTSSTTTNTVIRRHHVQGQDLNNNHSSSNLNNNNTNDDDDNDKQHGRSLRNRHRHLSRCQNYYRNWNNRNNNNNNNTNNNNRRTRFYQSDTFNNIVDILLAWGLILSLSLFFKNAYLYYTLPDPTLPLPGESSTTTISGDQFGNVRVGAYYYSWYNEQQWKTWKTKYTPTIGLYESTHLGVIKKHMEYATQANIDFFIISSGYSNNQGIIDSFQSIIRYLETPMITLPTYPSSYNQHNNKMKFIPIAIHIESLMLFEQCRIPTTVQKLDPKLNGLLIMKEKVYNILQQQKDNDSVNNNPPKITTFGEVYRDYIFKVMDEIILPYQDKYVFVNDNKNNNGHHNQRRPVFVLYLAREFLDFETCMIKIKYEFYRKYGVYPYFIADVIWYETDTRVLHNTHTTGRYVWDSITSYNRYEGRTNNETLDTYLQRLQHEYTIYSNIKSTDTKNNEEINNENTKQVRLPVVPYVQPGYDDSLIRSEEHISSIATRPIYSRGGKDGTTYRQFWNVAMKLLYNNPCDETSTTSSSSTTTTSSSNDNFVFISTFNEWHESTSIEPSYEWGTKYLELTKYYVDTIRRNYQQQLEVDIQNRKVGGRGSGSSGAGGNSNKNNNNNYVPTCDSNAIRPRPNLYTKLRHWYIALFKSY